MRPALPAAIWLLSAAIAACSRGPVSSAPQPIVDAASTEATASPPTKAAELPTAVVTREPGDAKVRVAIARSESTAAPSFHGAYFDIFRRHAPVYVTADAILHAWHESYDQILMDLETSTLAPALASILDALRQRLATTSPSATRADLDAYLTIAARLATDTDVAPTAGGDPNVIASVVQRAKSAAGPGPMPLFGAQAAFDYSMLKPRGHYTRTVALSRYFRVMSFLGRTEIRIAERTQASDRWRVNRAALAAATLLRSSFGAKEEKEWRAIDATLTAFVGPEDSLSPFGADLGSLASANDETVARTLEGASKQRIGTQLLHRGDTNVSVLFLGQRYVFDSEVLGAVTYGALATKRMMPTPLDVATVVFGSPTANALLASEKSRWGAEYVGALGTLTKMRDDAGDSLWKGSLHHQWLGALRELSPNAERDAGLPDPLLGEAWNRRLLNTQLASWAELRHDDILYAKQSFTAGAACEYPHAYVDPYPRFFAALEDIARRGSDTMKALPWKSGNAENVERWFATFGDVAKRLRAIAERERRNEELTTEDIAFMNRMVSMVGRNAGCTVEYEPGGWFADLYFGAAKKKLLAHEPVIADIHTQPTDENGNPVGKVLHVGVGMPRTLKVTIAHDAGAHTLTYEGAVSTYAETTTTSFERLTDEAWQARIRKGPTPTPPWIVPAVER